jgi:predicted AAA+ superfamily ATPase
VKDIAAIRDDAQLLRMIEMLACRTASLLNISDLANELGMRRDTTEKYLAILERLFLVRRLPAWHRNPAKRLVKTPKIHMLDTGLATTLRGLTAADWHNYSTDFGPVLESFAVQQLICEASWIDTDLQFFHYRDKDQLEVDLVIEQGKNVWGVEVKKAASIQHKDGAGLSRLAAHAGSHFKGGMLLYTGNNFLPLAQANCFAVPISALWR